MSKIGERMNACMDVLESGFKVVECTVGEITDTELAMLRVAYFAGAKDGIEVGKIISNADEASIVETP